MVARGDLGTEIPSEMLPIVQKRMIRTARQMGKLAIVATEMLETMMENNRPKRAETSDIANAVLDGTDAVMLSGETTVGKHPVETVQAMANICETTEKYAAFDYISIKKQADNVPSAIAECVVESANRLDAKLICAATITGSTARLISNLKPNALERIDNLCESQYADPAHADIKHRRKPFRTGDPADFYDNADQCDCPDKSEQEISDRTFQNDQADWCVASGNQYKDHTVV